MSIIPAGFRGLAAPKYNKRIAQEWYEFILNDESGQMMAMRQHDPRQYNEVWAELNHKLREVSCGGLGVALDALHRQQLDQGFVRDDLTGLQRYIFRHAEDEQRYFAVQFNPARTQRFNGSGLMTPPPGAERVHDGCFLCFENVQWQQSGIEIGFDIQVGDRSYIAWMNPYPLLPGHAVIASREHVRQAWRESANKSLGKSLEVLISDLVVLASRLPGWIGFYNGPGAGASIPNHFHYQFLRRPAGYGAFPLEVAALGKLNGFGGKSYPLGFAHWHGELNSVIHTAGGWIRDWVSARNSGVSVLTANVIAIADTVDEVDLYFVPRDQARSRSPGMSGLIGGLEALGELVFSSDEEKHRLDTSKVDFHTVEQILANVSVPI